MTAALPYVLEVGGQEVVLTPDPAHEFTATTEQVALGYGVSAEAVRSLKIRRDEELLEGKHWVAVANCNAAGTVTLWTKRGIVRLGFFIRSARARLFRDMAEDLVLSSMAAQPAPAPTTGPRLISNRIIAKALGITSKCAAMQLKRAGIQPTHHFSTNHHGGYAFLYPHAEVEHFYAAPLPIFEGHAVPGIGKIYEERRKRLRRGKVERAEMPRLLTDRVQAAQELVQIEQRRAYLLGVLGSPP